MYYGEKLNSISHLVGAVLALVGFGALLTLGVQSGDPWIIVSFVVFGLTIVLLYTMSTLYNSFSPPKLKRLFQLLDHVSIYLLIAGTCTPYMLISLRHDDGFLMLGIVWLLALIGILSEIFTSGTKIKVIQMLIYLAMGWSCSFQLDSLREVIPEAGIVLLIAGGLAYTTGIIFYLLDLFDKLTHAHGLWHFFVLAGSIAHFISIIGYVR
jgi:hemolysin III|tara:strand:+ start:228 stop:857 length:630 start_codon:yes stop_codon:yes gene_type:complete